jgi:DNA repair protein RecO (recombination protein O)
MRRRIELESAYVLAQRPYRETSLLVEAFAEHQGRVGLVARGARGPKSKQRALLQPFTPLLLSWTESGELGTVTAAEAAGMSIPLAGEQVFNGWYVNELLLKLLPRNDPHPLLYRHYVEVLPALAATDVEPALRTFELRLLAEIGYGMEFPGDLDPGDRYRCDPERGVERAATGEPASCGGTTLIALRDGSLAGCGAVERREARTLLRAALRRQLGGRELETPQLLRALRARAPSNSDSESNHG